MPSDNDFLARWRDHFFFEERGINSHNVAVSATNSMTTNEQAMEADPFVSAGIAESIIPTLILPQADSARHGVELLGRYVECHGPPNWPASSGRR